MATVAGDMEVILDSNNNARSKQKSKMSAAARRNYEKYSLRPRSIQNRIETEKRQKSETKKQPKPKQKPPPLSKYRRKTANARERSRMKEINTAFDALQRAVPQYPILPVNSSGKTCEKLTKITTLRLAMNYIESLATLLNPPVVSLDSMDEFSSSAGSECSPASSYTMSPLSSPPECIQTVMRSVVSPSMSSSSSSSSFASSPNSVCSSSSSSPQSSSYSASSSPSTSAVSNSYVSSSPTSVSAVITPKIINNHPSNNSHHHHHHPHHQMSLTNGLVMSSSNSVASFVAECLPPPMTIGTTTTVPSTGPLPSIATITGNLLTAGLICATTNNNTNNNVANNRAGSLSSFTESEFSEYTSDLLSDEGSTLDDPMFEDLIGVGAVASDFPDLLLDSDGDSLHFSSDLSDN